MDRLPLVQADLSDMREWLTPTDIRAAFRIQPRFVLPDWLNLRWTVLCIIIPSIFFLRWVLPRVARPAGTIYASWSCSVCLVWAFSAVLGFAAAAFLNPGVVPRTPSSCEPRIAPAPRYVRVNGTLIKQRWCNTCQVHRPLRAKHCSYCDRCIFRFDHHCTWLGNCVGLGNYRSFLILVLAASLFFGHSATLTWRALRQELRGDGMVEPLPEASGGTLRKLLVTHMGMSLYVAYSCVMFLAFLVLLLYHAIIIGSNLTTNEHVRDYYLARNPYDTACVQNYRQIFCAPYGEPVKIESDPIEDGARWQPSHQQARLAFGNGCSSAAQKDPSSEP